MSAPRPTFSPSRKSMGLSQRLRATEEAIVARVVASPSGSPERAAARALHFAFDKMATRSWTVTAADLRVFAKANGLTVGGAS